MSPEAKQAAEAIDATCTMLCLGPNVEEKAKILQPSFDAATAKLREELDVARSELGRRAAATAKLREELERLRFSMDICVGAAGCGSADELCGWIDKARASSK
jgi:hypothetical protein